MSQSSKPTVSAYLQDLQKKSGGLSEYFGSFEQLFDKRLWHQLSVKLLEFVQLEQAKQFNLVELYENFIADFETKINQLTLVEIVVFIVQQINNKDEAITFSKNTRES